MKINLKGVNQYPNLNPPSKFEVPSYRVKMTEYTMKTCQEIFPSQTDYEPCMKNFFPAFDCIANKRAEKFGEVNDNYNDCIGSIEEAIKLTKKNYPNMPNIDIENANSQFKTHCRFLSTSEKPFA